MEGFFTFKTFIRLFAAAIVLAAVIVLIDERNKNSRGYQVEQEVEVTRVVERTVLVTQIVDHIITSTPQPITATPVDQQITETSTATEKVTALDVLENGVSIYCQPQISYEDISMYKLGQIPKDAVKASIIDGSLTVITQVKSCTFLVAFNGEVPDGVYLKVQDLGPSPFINEKLTPLDTNSTIAYASTSHYFVIDPPYWQVTFIVSVIGPNDEILWTESVVFKRKWIPDPCPNGILPDAITDKCE